MPKNAHAPASSELLTPLHTIVEESRANCERLARRLKERKLDPDQLAAEMVDTVMSIVTDGFEKVLITLGELEEWADGVDEDVGLLLKDAEARAEEGDEPALLPEQATELKTLLWALLAEVPMTCEVRGVLEERVAKQQKFIDEITMTDEDEESDEGDEDEEDEETESTPTDTATN